MIGIAIDRLDARRHTFGLLLEQLIGTLRDVAPDLDLVLVRRRGRTDIRVERVPELFVPAWLSRNVVYERMAPHWFRRRGLKLVHFPFLCAPQWPESSQVRRVVTIHGASRAALQGELVTRFSDAQLRRTRRRLRAVDRIITVSESARREVIEHYELPAELVTVIYNGVGPAFHPGAARKEVLERHGIRRPYLVTVATLKPKKNVTTAVRAFYSLVTRNPSLPHQLVLVGYKARGYSEVDDVVADLGLQGRVIQTGWVRTEDVPSFYAGAEALLFPSRHEGFGLPLVEAMASGCPVVAANVYSIPEVGGDAILTEDPLDYAGFCRALERILFEPGFREALVAKGLSRAERFSWEKAARQTAQVYRDVLSTCPSRDAY
jgi:glycosyltransferase involved in cell wall biosynthesis